MQAHTIRSQSIADKAAVKAVIQYLAGDTDWTIYITETGESRSLAQNALYWGWVDDFVKTTNNTYAGNDKNYWHFTFRENFLSRIYERDNPEYAETMQEIRNVYRQQMQKEAKRLRKAVVGLTSTREATVKQFTEYLIEIERHAAFAGIQLRTDAGVYAVAMGAR